MQLPGDAIMAKAKVTKYLLVRQSKWGQVTISGNCRLPAEECGTTETDLRQILKLSATPVVESAKQFDEAANRVTWKAHAENITQKKSKFA